MLFEHTKASSAEERRQCLCIRPGMTTLRIAMPLVHCNVIAEARGLMLCNCCRFLEKYRTAFMKISLDDLFVVYDFLLNCGFCCCFMLCREKVCQCSSGGTYQTG
ncbi:hypothetical protein Droror1_Dr00019255 [Drosera rotundifolia]